MNPQPDNPTPTLEQQETRESLSRITEHTINLFLCVVDRALNSPDCSRMTLEEKLALREKIREEFPDEVLFLSYNGVHDAGRNFGFSAGFDAAMGAL